MVLPGEGGRARSRQCFFDRRLSTAAVLSPNAIHWEFSHREATIQQWTQLFGCHEESWQSGKAIFRQGDTARDVFLLISGLVILTWDEPDGSEGVLGLRFPGQVIDLCAHGLGIPYPVSARTTGRSKLCRVPLAAFEAKARDNVHVGHFFGHLLRIELYNAARYIVNLKTATPADRFERFLQYFASASGEASRARSEGIFIPLRDYQIAELMGLSVRHFERVKHQLQSSGRLQLKGPHRFLLTPSGPRPQS
jgi:CRP-like cAMP-binding protein